MNTLAIGLAGIGIAAALSARKPMPVPSEEEIRKRIAQNGSITKAAKSFGVSFATLKSWMTSRGVASPKHGRPSKPMPSEEMLRAAFSIHGSINRVAKHFGVTPFTVSIWIRKRNIDHAEYRSVPLRRKSRWHAKPASADWVNTFRSIARVFDTDDCEEARLNIIEMNDVLLTALKTGGVTGELERHSAALTNFQKAFRKNCS